MVKPGKENIETSYPSSPPLFMDDAETVEKNHFEINLSAGFSGNKDVWESETPLLDVNYGLTENVHVNSEIPYVFGQDADGTQAGFGRPALAVKFRLLHRDGFQIAVHPSLKFPPLPNISLDAHGSASLTIPLVLDLALGHTGIGMGFEFSRAIELQGKGGGWASAIGFACPIESAGNIMIDFTTEADENFELGENWFEIGYVREKLFGTRYLNLLSELGVSTIANVSIFFGIQIAL